MFTVYLKHKTVVITSAQAVMIAVGVLLTVFVFFKVILPLLGVDIHLRR